MSEKPTLVIGDVHGHFDRLERLLLQEEILGRCPDCDGTGDWDSIGKQPEMECPACHGDGQRRINYDVTVIQLGDLGHFGGASGSPTGDQMCYLYAPNWLDTVLWGNHDRALVDPVHEFGGYTRPSPDTLSLVYSLMGQGKMKMAAAAHGYLICHAGIARGWSHRTVNKDASEFAAYLNRLDEAKLRNRTYEERFHVLDAIPKARGGADPFGGVLWMDWELEAHLPGKPFKFICGHTANKQGKIKKDGYGNWNIDIGGKDEARLAGLWLEEGRQPRPVRIEL